MRKIDTYSFGKMVIEGKPYTSDLVIFPDRIDSSWWRKQGHLLQREDLSEILAEKPDILIIGTGAAGVMKVPAGLREEIRGQNIELHVERTGKAADTYNRLAGMENKRVFAAFHLTC